MKKFISYAAVLAATAAIVAPAASAATFTDVKAGSEQEQAIESLVERGIVSGYSDGTFRPANQVTRAQAAKILAGVLQLDVDNVTNPGFHDVPTTHPNYKYIAALANEGIINGHNGYYNPNGILKRGQVSKILVNSFGLEGTTALPFTDVPGSGYEPYIEALYARELTTGKSPTYFGVYDSVTRGQLAVFIHRIEEALAFEPIGDGPYPHGSGYAFTTEMFGEEYISGSVLNTKSDGALDIVLDEDSQEVTFIPYQEGTDYIFVGGYDAFNGVIKKETVRYYRVDVTEQEDGFETIFTELDEAVYDDAVMYIGEGVRSVEILTEDGEPVDVQKYGMFDGENGEELHFTAEAGTYVIHVQYEDGTEQVKGAMIDFDYTYINVSVGDYVEGSDYYMAYSDLQQGLFEGETDFTDVELEPLPNAEGVYPVIGTLSEIEGGRHLAITAEQQAINTLWLLNGEEQVGEFFLQILPTQYGYIVNLLHFNQ